jgi:DNA polymerase III subunit epsilon
MTKIYIADTETTGLSRDDRVVEWAHIVCTLQNNQLVEVSRFETLVNPGKPISEGASKVHGITDEMVKDAPAITEVLPKALGLLKGEHLEMYGHNFPSYDMQFIDGLLPKNADIGCSLKAARTFLGTPKNSLDFLREHIGLGDGLAHSALGDCDTTLRLINYMLKDRTWEVLSSCMLARPTTISFGKHKGKKLEELPEDYVYWLLNKADNLSWELRRALEEV